MTTNVSQTPSFDDMHRMLDKEINDFADRNPTKVKPDTMLALIFDKEPKLHTPVYGRVYQPDTIGVGVGIKTRRAIAIVPLKAFIEYTSEEMRDFRDNARVSLNSLIYK